MSSFRAMVASVLVLSLCGVAEAATLSTPPIDKDGFGTFSSVSCSIVNVGKKDRTVKIEVWLTGAAPPD